MPAYPGALAALPIDMQDGDDAVSGVNNGTVTEGFLASRINDLADEINAVQAELGINPSASFATVLARLNGQTTVRKTADQVNSTVTLAAITDLSFPVITGADYTFDFTIPYSSAATTTGAAFSISGIATAGGYLSYDVEIGGFAADGAASNFTGQAAGTSDSVLSTAVLAANVVYIARIRGVASNVTSSGTLQVNFRSEIAASAITVKKGAHGILYTG